MLQLHNLEKLHKSRKRVGRGGDKGGTSGRGHKGQKARSGGKVKASFEGGQMSITRRLPKRGFGNKRFAKVVSVISLADLERKFEAGQTVDAVTLSKCGLVKEVGLVKHKRKSYLIKLLGNGQLSKSLTVCIDTWSASAAQAVEKAGGTIRRPKENLHGSDAS